MLVALGGPKAIVAHELSAQSVYTGGHVEVSVIPQAGIGSSVTVERGVWRRARVGFRWTSTQTFVACTVSHGPSECSADPVVYEVSGRAGLGVGAAVAPFIGVGSGLYRRTWRTSRSGSYLERPQRDSSPVVAVIGGFDVAVARPLVLRVSMVYQEVFDKDLEALYGRRPRLTGFSAGVGLATW